MNDASLDICVVTKCQQNRVFDFIDSVAEHCKREILDNVIFRICYTGDSIGDIADLQSRCDARRIRCTICQRDFNFAENSDFLAKQGSSELILFANDDILLQDDAVEHCLDIFKNDDKKMFGTVGLKLVYENGTIQHYGQMTVVDRDNGLVGVTHYGLKMPDAQTSDIIVSGNTGAFLMIRRSDFEAAGGFDSGYRHCFEDVQLNWQMLMLGRYNVCVGTRRAVHFESTTRKQELCREDIQKMFGFYQANRDKILQKMDDLNRTIVRRI